jgi:enoyl-CoA hydratase/carnithine racemase
MQGICFTIAIELMLAADVVFAAEDCRFSQLEVKRGIMPGYGGTFRFIERAGWGNAMKWLLTGDEFSAAEAHRLGLVQEVVPVGEQFDRALAYAQRVAEQAPLAVQATIENARLALGQGWIHAATHCTAKNTFLYGTEDAAEGRRSFVEKRVATFVGR